MRWTFSRCKVTHFWVFLSAPGQPPLNIEWNLIGSQLTLHWDPVIALETESEVTGYQVSARLLIRCQLNANL